jgi:carbamoylphosphate synthase small subunit
MHDFFWDGHLLGLAVDDTPIFSSQLHPEYSEVGTSKIQGIEQPCLIPTA